jgi:hypothetical protein
MQIASEKSATRSNPHLKEDRLLRSSFSIGTAKNKLIFPMERCGNEMSVVFLL